MGKEDQRVKTGSKQSDKLERRIAFVQEFIKLWRQYFEKFAEGFEGRKILKRDEEEFSRILNSLAHHHSRFTAAVYPEMKNTDAIMKILCETVSLSHLKSLSEAQLIKLQIDWHSIFIDMNKGLGRLIARRPLTPEEEQMLRSGQAPADLKPRPKAPVEEEEEETADVSSEAD